MNYMNEKGKPISEEQLVSEIVAGKGIKLPDLATRLAVTASTVFRWVTLGLPDGIGTRVRLQAIKRGKSWVTTDSAVKAFFGRLPDNQ